MNLEWMPPSLISPDSSNDHAPPSIFIIYSIPALLLLAVIFIIKWRPCYEFSGVRHCLRWYLYCCSKETLKEMQSVDRERILTIDAESLASSSFYDSPRLPLKRNSIELCSAGECQPSSVITTNTACIRSQFSGNCHNVADAASWDYNANDSRFRPNDNAMPTTSQRQRQQPKRLRVAALLKSYL
ncbi:unnamed protein product [Heligmosomoides polygyrus]|uniref:Uncharacterized protein n=1 Tax=Heligmosomoides polygyrus TaxID=6339 RepID=A0A3P7Z049_HELPZ|nr:unnamed protein product [Heligmosomoides polygyrus]